MRNNYYILILILLLTTSLQSFAQEGEVVTMNLEECLQYGLENSELVNISKLEIDKQKAYVGEITSEGLPQINASADFNANLKLRTQFLPAEFFPDPPPGAKTVPVQFGTTYGGDIGIRATQMIFNGSYFVGLQAAKTLKELTQKEHIQTKIDVASAIKKAYYLVLVAEESLNTIQANYNRLDSLLKETTIMYENGFTEKIEVSRTKVQFNNIKTSLENSTRDFEFSKDILKYNMGLPNEVNLKIADRPSNFKTDYSSVINAEVNANRRIEYKILSMRKELATLDLRNNKVQYLPRMDFYFNFGWNAGTQTSKDLFTFSNQNWFNYEMLGITASLPIFDGLKKSKRIQQNKITLSQYELRESNLERSINNEIKDTKILLINSLEELKNQKENMELAEEVYNVTKIKYQEGIGSSIELMDADNEYKVSQSLYLNALLNSLLLKVDYEKALGILLEN